MNELVSCLLHGLGVVAVICATPQLMSRVGPGWDRRSAVLIHSATIAFMLAMSSVYHLACHSIGEGQPWTEFFRRLDYLGVWTAMAGFYVLPQLILHRGAWRWGPLIGVALGGSAGAALCMWRFNEVSGPEVVPPYALVSVVGCVATAKLIQLRGWRGTRWLQGFWLGMAGGAVFFVTQPPDLIPGLFGHHEIWHVGVLFAVYCHWRFALEIAPEAEGELLPELRALPLRAQE